MVTLSFQHSHGPVLPGVRGRMDQGDVEPVRPEVVGTEGAARLHYPHGSETEGQG